MRLPKLPRPERYDLALHVDPAKPRFKGELALELEVAADTRATRAARGRPRDRVERGRPTRRGVVKVAKLRPNPERETVSFVLDRPLAAGRATLRVRYTGPLRADLRGLYLARSGKRRYAATQLEAADARRFFPCFDEPDKKARFRLRRDHARARTGRSRTGRSSGPSGAAHGSPTTSPRRRRSRPTWCALVVGELESSRAGARGLDTDPCLVRAGQEEARRLRARVRGPVAAPARGVLRPALPVRQARPDRGARLRVRRDGERGRGHLPRDAAARRREDRLAGREEARRRGHRARARAHVVRRPRHHGLVGRPVAERGVRHLDGLQGRRRLEARVEHVARLRVAARAGLRARRDGEHAPDLRRGERAERGDRELRRDHLREGRVGGAHAGELARARRVPRRRAALHPPPPRGERARGRSVARARGEREAAGRAGRARRGSSGRASRWSRRGGSTAAAQALLVAGQERFFANPKVAGGGARRDAADPARACACAARAGKDALVRALAESATTEIALGPSDEVRWAYLNADEASFVRALHDAPLLRALGQDFARLRRGRAHGAARPPVGGRARVVRAARRLARPGRAPRRASREPRGARRRARPARPGSTTRSCRWLRERAAARFRAWLAEIFAPAFEQLGWKPARGESENAAPAARAALLSILGGLAERRAGARRAPRRASAPI